jgi:hypothetical protein
MLARYDRLALVRDDLRRRILARRAAFLAAAVAGTTANCGPCNPMVCLEPPIVETPRAEAASSADAATDAPPD